eukprot:8584294-Ditylum_brightwellii.AAC.1
MIALSKEAIDMMNHCSGGRNKKEDGIMVVTATLEDVKLALWCTQNNVHVASSGVNHYFIFIECITQNWTLQIKPQQP